MSSLSYKDKNILEKLYWEDGLSCHLIGQEFGVGEHTIRYWMNKSKIPRRAMSEAVKIVYAMGHRTTYNKGKCLSKEHKKAVSDGLKIAYQSGRRKAWNKDKKASIKHRKAISKGLKRAYAEGRRKSLKGVPSPIKGITKVSVSREKLEKFYWEDGLPASEIAKKLGVSETTIYNYMHKMDVPTRTRAEAIRKFNLLILARQACYTKPNNAEKRLMDIIQNRNLPFKYVGDWRVIIEGKCPDFINFNGKKQIIELFGDYWHNPEEVEVRKKFFAKYGYNTLVIWEHELKSENNVVEKIEAFSMGGM